MLNATTATETDPSLEAALKLARLATDPAKLFGRLILCLVRFSRLKLAALAAVAEKFRKKLASNVLGAVLFAKKLN